MYAHSFDGEGTVRRIGDSAAPVGDRRLATFALIDADGREVARLLTSPFSRGAIPFMSSHTHITTPPTAFVSAENSARLRDGMRVCLKVGGRFLPGRRERNVIAEIPGKLDEHVIVSAHYDSVYRGPGAIDNASGVEGVRRLGEGAVGEDKAALGRWLLAWPRCWMLPTKKAFNRRDREETPQRTRRKARS